MGGEKNTSIDFAIFQEDCFVDEFEAWEALQARQAWEALQAWEADYLAPVSRQPAKLLSLAGPAQEDEAKEEDAVLTFIIR